MFEFFEHTADLGLRVRAADLDTLFEEAIYTPLAQQGRLTAYVSDHRYYSVGSLNRLWRSIRRS